MTQARWRVATRIAGLLLFACWTALVYPHARVAVGSGHPSSWLVAAGGAALLLTLLAPLRRALASAIERPPRWVFLACASTLAAGVSAAMVWFVLDGKPISRDSAVYLMEARALAAGALGMHVPEPALGSSARFLLAGADHRIYGVFPPGWPAALVPFVWVGLPFAAGPVVAALMVPVQHALCRTLGGSELAARSSVLLTFASAARVFETADLLSHAFVALTGSAALALAGDTGRPLDGRRALAAGALAGWATCARLLDGVVLGAGVGIVLVLRIVSKRGGARSHHLACFALGAVPFAALLFMHQHAATGSWSRPTQLEYFARSDWPTTCHRLGFGRDVGCRVEHPETSVIFGDDGYDLQDAWLVTSDRAGRLGDDLFACVPLLLVALLAPVLRPTRATLGAALLATAFTLSYGLFYYGNAPVFGARHLFPIAPLLWALAAIALDGARARSAAPTSTTPSDGRGVVGVVVVIAVMVTVAPSAWTARVAQVRPYRDSLPDVRRALERAGVESGIVLVASGESLVGAMGPHDRQRGLVYVRSESLLPLVRALHPRRSVFRVHADERVERIGQRVAPRLRYPLAWSWPAFVRPTRASVVPAERERLIVHQAELDATVTIPIWVPSDGRYHVALHGISTSVSGRWLPRIGGHVGPVFDGYGDRVSPVSVVWPRSVQLARGYSALELRAVGRDARSTGLLAAFETLDLERDRTHR